VPRLSGAVSELGMVYEQHAPAGALRDDLVDLHYLLLLMIGPRLLSHSLCECELLSVKPALDEFDRVSQPCALVAC
jgi:hypothetical protein